MADPAFLASAVIVPPTGATGLAVLAAVILIGVAMSRQRTRRRRRSRGGSLVTVVVVIFAIALGGPPVIHALTDAITALLGALRSLTH